MTTYISGLFNINGVVSPNQTVMDNINTIAAAAGAWVTYDIAEGKWSVIINRAGSSVASFDDSNILGGISISGTGINQLYNAVSIEFPHKDLRDQRDYIDLEIASADRYPNELDNRLNISVDLMNDPIQAEYIASVELKQNRVDKIISFRTDFSKIGLKAGDLISVTSTQYAFTSKVFRIVEVSEEDEEGLIISITALEYDANVYSTAGLVRKERTKKTGIVPKSANSVLNGLESLGAALSAAGGGAMVLATVGVQTYTLPPSPVSSGQVPFDTKVFTAPFTGQYIVQILFDQNASNAVGNYPGDVIIFGSLLFNANSQQLGGQVSGGSGIIFWQDVSVSYAVNLIQGQQYALAFDYINETVTPGNVNVTVNWQVYTAVVP
jgi:hypothetical protein